eukprot:CAMPEP_0182890100 /NCGR_PEP_ID=MMETSP0034_2-20130328/22444_1 /TAXON_ID=156128 /ORGANISM="Nephroselmis pyriformis, Strain CCMP717" /LENGTH=97 /DNA_ID=CAMNT_0025023629 /DNA_START=240 /DNA_END=529 /DNA_ORIENTATION=-
MASPITSTGEFHKAWPARRADAFTSATIALLPPQGGWRPTISPRRLMNGIHEAHTPPITTSLARVNCLADSWRGSSFIWVARSHSFHGVYPGAQYLG